MEWKILTKNVNLDDPVVKKLFDEAIAASPDNFIHTNLNGELVFEDTVAMLPRRSLKGVCRLCGEEIILSKEHIPPKSSGNKCNFTKMTLDDWLKNHLETDTQSKKIVEQGGIFGFTLCRKCNSLTGQLYGDEYKKWVILANNMITNFGVGMIPKLDGLEGPFGEMIDFGSKKDGGVRPGAFVRQVLSCMCSLSGSWDLAEKYPVLRRIILEKSVEKLPNGMEIGMSIYFGPKVRIFGPQLIINVKTGIWRWCQEMAFPPFAFVMVIASNSIEPGIGLLIDNMTEVDPDERQNFKGVVEMGFGWTPYLGDYRSKAAIIANR